MAIPTSAPATATMSGDQVVEFRGLDWAAYSTMLRLRGDRTIPRMVYLDGTLWLMSPSFSHERLKERLGDLVKAIVMGFRIPSVIAGQTTLRRKKRRGGVEGDQAFYLANEALVRGKERIDLRVDPPPDLAIEAVHTHEADAAIKVYRRLGVPEVWVCDRSGLVILVRQADGRHRRSGVSLAFPFLTGAEVSELVLKPQDRPDTEWLLDMHRWVAETLLGRREEHP